MLTVITETIGHFHPLLVHLPIGILLMAIVLLFLTGENKYTTIPIPVLKIVWVTGTVSAVLSCVTGYMLFINGEYDESTVLLHLWMGIAVALVSLIVCFRLVRKQITNRLKWVAVILFLLISGAGHYGGTLTHGENYLFPSSKKVAEVIKPVPNIQEAIAYNDVIVPIFKARCYGCHGPNKQKGELRMDNIEDLMKGGEDGAIILPGDAENSEIIKRLLLPVSHKEHMPPRQEAQLSEEQTDFIHWWVEMGGSFDKKVNQLEQPGKIIPVLEALEKGTESSRPIEETLPAVEPARTEDIENLRKKNVLVLPVANNSNYLSVNFIATVGIDNEMLNMLTPLKKQLLILKINDLPLEDTTMQIIGQLEQLQTLQVKNTHITDKGIASLKNLQKLQSLNLSGTRITNEGVLQLKNLKSLRQVFLYQSGIDKQNWEEIQSALPGIFLDTGGYTVPTLTTDTTEISY